MVELECPKVDFGQLTLGDKRKLIDVEKELVLQEQIELSLIMPPPPAIDQLWFNTIIQIGHISFFSLSFPIAPLWGVLMGVLQTNVMFWVMTSSIQRVPSLEAESIGIWEDIIHVYSMLALIINAGILLFSTKGVFALASLDSLSQLDLYTVTVGLIIAENVIFVLKFLIAALIPDEPKWVYDQHQNRSRLKNFTLEAEIKKRVAEQKRRILQDSSLMKQFHNKKTDPSDSRRLSSRPPGLSGPSGHEGGIMAMFMEQFDARQSAKQPTK